MKDILKDNISLKQEPYSLPEGYFEELKEALKSRKTSANGSEKKPLVATIAATFAVLLAAGGFFLSRLSVQEEFTMEDYLVFSEDMTNAIYSYSTEEQYADAISEDDIIEYLIYTGVEVEYIEQD